MGFVRVATKEPFYIFTPMDSLFRKKGLSMLQTALIKS